MQISTIHSFCLEFLKSRDIQVKLIDDDSSERKTLFIKKFSEELGFIAESTVLDYQIPAVISKFGEYGSFNVDSNMLGEMISDSRFTHFSFFFHQLFKSKIRKQTHFITY